MSSPNIKLFHANWSLCSQMVRVALYEKGLNFSEKHIKLCDQYPEGENLCKDFLRLNPLGTVPVIKINEKDKSTILISTDTEELLKLSDRIAVIYKGKLSKIMNSEEVTPEIIGLLMGGGTVD